MSIRLFKDLVKHIIQEIGLLEEKRHHRGADVTYNCYILTIFMFIKM